MRTLNGREFLKIQTLAAAASALESCPEYWDMWPQFVRASRTKKKPGQKLLCYAHQAGLNGYIQLTNKLAKAAGTSVEQLFKAYPSEWYSVGDGGVFVRFPESIDYRDDLRSFHYCGLGVA